MADLDNLSDERTDVPEIRREKGRKRKSTKVGKQPRKARRDLALTSTSIELPTQQLPSQAAEASLPSPQTVLQHSQALLQPVQTMPRPSVPCDNSSLSPFAQFSIPSANIFAAPLLNSTPQATIPHVPSSFAPPNTSTLGILNSLNDDKLGIILPVLVRMENKIDQLISILSSSLSSGKGNHLNTAAMVVSHSNVASESQNNIPSVGASITPKPKTSNANIPSNARLMVAKLIDTSGEDNEEENESDHGSSAESSFKMQKSLPGMTSRQHIQLEMAKITEKNLPDDLNLPIPREDLIALQARSTSTMNFSVRLLRELFTREELVGRNISGVRGKERVDPARVEIIKQILFKIYRTSPSEKELLWSYCRKAMDSYLRKMQRPVEVVKDHYDLGSAPNVGSNNDIQ